MDQTHLHTLSQALLAGKQLTNGPQWLSYSVITDTGFLFCDEEGCCDTYFDGICEILETLAGDVDNEWKVVEGGSCENYKSR